MRITKISVKGLFGMFDHEIPLNQESRITIIHGPNGVGKTALMRMVYGLLRRDYQVFVELPFKEFSIITKNGAKCGEFRVVKKNFEERNDEDNSDEDNSDEDNSDDEARTNYPFEISHYRSGKLKEGPISPRRFREDDPRERRLISRTLQRMHGLEHLGSNRWLDPRIGDIMSMQEAVEKYDVHSLLGDKDELTELKSFRKRMTSRLIRVERLSVFRQDEIHSRDYRRLRPSDSIRVDTVEELRKDIRKRIDDTTERFAKKSNELDSTFPQRVIDEGKIRIDQDLRRELKKLDKYRNDLEELGLLDEYGGSAGVDASRPSVTERADSAEALQKILLSTYIKDNRAKLDTFNEIFKQLSLLTSIINKRFENKQLAIHRRKGFVITGHDKKPIGLTSLSSGEQHELVLLYQLLLQTTENSLIMIDEPELSLHVEWQRDFLDDLEDIIKTRKFDVLIATHSPQIVDDKWDWMVDLGETEEDDA